METIPEKSRILIVEDNVINYKLLEKRIQLFGHVPIGPALTGESAVQMALEDKPDLILMDIRLQGEMDGIEAAGLIKEKSHIPVIYITAHTESEFLQRAKPTIPHGYLTKPFQEKELQIAIEMALFASRLDEKRRIAEEALRESEEKYRQLFNSAPAGIMDIDFNENRIVDVNEAACRTMEYSYEEILQINPVDLLSEESKTTFLNHVGQIVPGEFVTDSVEYQVVTKTGKTKWVLLSINYNMDGDSLTGISVVAHDVTEQKLTKKKLRKAEEKASSYRNDLEIYSQLTPLGIIVFDSEFNITSWNPSAERIFGYTAEEAIGQSTFDIIVPEYEHEIVRKELMKPEKNVSININDNKTKDGKIIHVQWFNSPKFDSEGNVTGLISSCLDITEKVNIETALKESESKHKHMVANISDVIAILDEKLVTIYNSPNISKLFGWPSSKLIGKNALDVVHPEDLEKVRNEFEELRGTDFSTKTFEFRYECIDGNYKTIELTANNLVKDPVINGFLINYHDVTEKIETLEALKEAEERFRIAFKTSPDAININRLRDGLYVDVNDGFTKLTGFTRKDSIGKTSSEIDIWYDPADRSKLVQGLIRNGYYDNLEAEFRRKDGTTATALMSARMTELNGEPHIISITRDISERKYAEKLLKESEEKYRKTFESIPDIVSITEVSNGRYSYVNSTFCEITGYSVEEVIGQTPIDLNFYADIEDRDKMMKEFVKTGLLQNYEMKFRKKDGTYFDTLFSARPIRIDDKDCLIALTKDISEQKKMEKEKHLLEEQLKQAQKMEAIGTLAGGIAHDFNNLLQGISGYTQLLLLDKDESDTEYHNLKEIYNLSNRASDLIRELLLFSRKADSIRRPVFLNYEVGNARKILERTIPKMIDIEVQTEGRLWTVMADPVQIEQILLNLATNASDAMPDGGKLVIETRNATLDGADADKKLGAKAGDYVLLRVTDTGHGIGADVQEKIFEPFFTTKEFGKGTGLGLASVYGIVKAHGGYITCYSEVGMGTVFSIYFPAVKDENDRQRTVPAIKKPEGGTETILLVDDESAIRDFAAQVFHKFGYKPVVASNGEEALARFRERQEEFDLVVIDLGMPGMGGHKCIEELLEINPKTKIIIASGYSINGQAKESMKLGVKGFVGKPYQLKELLETVRKVLDEKD